MKKYWVWLSLAFNYGSDKPYRLLSLYDNPKDIYNLSEDELKNIDFLTQRDIKAMKCTGLQRAENILEDCINKKIRVVCFDDEEYPKRLQIIYSPPMVIYALGSLKGIDNKIAISVVGTRNASDYSIKTTKKICNDLIEYDVLLVSGCAVGIDSVAHRCAVDNHKRTIAVLGCGLDINYPAQNRDLKIDILKNGGAIISEYPPKTQVSGANFPIRNRILAGLSCGVLVAQAPYRSGSLITASYALEQGRTIFCIPPSDIYSSEYSGVHNLIRDGATCIFGAEDIILEYFSDIEHTLDVERFLQKFATKNTNVKTLANNYSVKLNNKSRKTKSKKDYYKNQDNKSEEKKVKNIEYLENYSDEHKKVFNLLTETPQIIDEIVVKSQMSMSKVSALLLELELGGLIKSASGCRYALNI